MYDLIIIGGGPAGAAAGVYAARKQIKTAIIAESFNGQSIESNEIQNWIGTTAISGIDLAKKLKEHVKFYAGTFVDIKEGERVENIEHIENDGFLVSTNKVFYKTKAILIASGSRRKKLDIPGAKEFEGKGVAYCASCDGPFFDKKDVVVIGGGNAGFEAAAELLAYCKSVTLVSRGEFHADPITIEKVLENPKMTALTHVKPLEIQGTDWVKGLFYERTSPFVSDVKIEVQGVFVEIGHTPSTDFAENLGLEMDEYKQIKIDPKTQKTNIKGIWAAGDCTDGLYRQNNIAVGDAVRALEDIYLELQRMN